MTGIVHGAGRKALWSLSLALLLAAGAWADSFDWRNATVGGVTGDYVTAVENQLTAGTCWAFAAVGILEAKFDIASHNPNLNLDLSEQYLVSADVPGMGTIVSGDPYQALLYFRFHGISNEATLPYTDKKASSLPPPTPYYNLYGVTGVARFAADPTNVKLALQLYGPLITAVSSTHDLISYQPTATSTLTGSGGYLLDHAVDIIGYQDDPNAAGGGYYIVKSSWGTVNEGVNGYFFVTYATVQSNSDVMGIDGGTWTSDPPQSVVPEPISIVFFATGIVGILGFVTRRKVLRAA